MSASNPVKLAAAAPPRDPVDLKKFMENRSSTISTIKNINSSSTTEKLSILMINKNKQALKINKSKKLPLGVLPIPRLFESRPAESKIIDKPKAPESPKIGNDEANEAAIFRHAGVEPGVQEVGDPNHLEKNGYDLNINTSAFN